MLKPFYIILYLVVFGISENSLPIARLELFQKACFLSVAIFLVLKFGVNLRRTSMLAALWFAAFLSTIFLQLSGKAVSIGLVLNTAASFSAALLLYSARLPERHLSAVESAITYLPVLCVLAGFLFIPIGRYPWVAEYTGALRLRGASISAHLAMMCVLAIYLLCRRLLLEYQPKLYLALLVNLAILLATGTRGAIIAVVLPLLVFLFQKLFSKGKKGFYLYVFVLLGIMTALGGFANVMLRNSEPAGASAGGVNLSGRDVAWAFFYDKFLTSPLWGLGLGSVTQLSQGIEEDNLQSFVVPHNEYLRFLVDVGVTGASVFFVALLFRHFAVAKRAKRGERIWVCSCILSFLTYSFFDNTISTMLFFSGWLFFLQKVEFRKRNFVYARS